MREFTDEQFDKALVLMLDESFPSASGLLAIPGIYEILAEYYNNDVLDYLMSESEEQDND